MIPFQILLLVISKIFYSMGETKPVMWVNILAGFLDIIILNISPILNFNFLDKLNLVENFSELFKLTLIFIFSYITASIFLIWKLKNKIKNIVIFNFDRLVLKIFISLISLIITKFIWIYFDLSIGINFIQNIKNLIIFGLIFVFFVFFFSEVFREKNYLDFKKKILDRILK
jgi:hypothetical protein